MKDYNEIISDVLQKITKLECRNIKVEYVVMNSDTEEYLSNYFLNTFMPAGFSGIKPTNSSAFGYKILIDELLGDDEIKVVGGLQYA